MPKAVKIDRVFGKEYLGRAGERRQANYCIRGYIERDTEGVKGPGVKGETIDLGAGEVGWVVE